VCSSDLEIERDIAAEQTAYKELGKQHYSNNHTREVQKLSLLNYEL